MVGQVFVFLDEDSVLEKDTNVLRREKGNLSRKPTRSAKPILAFGRGSPPLYFNQMSN